MKTLQTILIILVLGIGQVAVVANAAEVKLNASDAEANDKFGYSVSISGDYAIVGARGEGTTGAGAAYIFYRNQGGANNWGQQQKINATDAETSDNFGYSVSISGDYAIVGAWHEDPGGTTDAGSAYSFLRSGSSWSQKKKQYASDAEASDLFGHSVSISGDYAIVGAYQEDPGGKSSAGSAYIYHSIDDLSLPVELSVFTATTSGESVILKWRTESEVNNIGFAIYRSEEKDGKYTRIAFVNGAGNSAMPTNYQFIDKKVEAGKTYFYYLEDIDITGEKTRNKNIKVVVPAKVAQSIPKEFRLLQNFPNPFNPETWLPYDLASDATVSIRIYALNGQLVRQLELSKQKAGSYLDKEKAAYWDGKDQLGQPVSSGVYFYTLSAGDFQATRKMVIMK